MTTWIKFLAMAAVVLVGLTTGMAYAVTVQLEVETNGEPIPNAEISLETPEGKEIKLTQTAELPKCDPAKNADTGKPKPPIEVTQDKSEPQTPSSSTDVPVETERKETGNKVELVRVLTDECGATSVQIDEELKDKPVYVVIRQDGKIIRRKRVDLTGDRVRISVSVPPLDFALSKSQLKTCRVGPDCNFALEIQSRSETFYDGPIFIADRMPVPVGLGPVTSDNWWCEVGRRGETLCFIATAHLRQGEKLRLDLPLRMRAYPYRRNSRNCAQILWPRVDLPLGEDRKTVQLLQLGANANGFDAGPVDGVIGRRTLIAFEALLERSRQNKADMNVLALMKALKWGGSLTQFNPMVNLAEQCTVIKVVQIARRPVHDRGGRRGSDIPVGELFELGIGIGIGIGHGRRHHRRDRHRRRHRERKFHD